MSDGHNSVQEAGGDMPPATVEVWDVFVRVFHWTLVVTFAASWLAADKWARVHEWTGYAAAALVVARIIWGIIGTRHARFSNFVHSPWSVTGYLGDLLQGTERRFLGHNPAGGAMIIALLTGILGLGVTGWMMTSDAFWGVDWVEDVHEFIANGVLALVALHVAGVLFASYSHRENLILSMFTGKKRTE